MRTAIERMLTSKHFVQYAAETEDVAARVSFLPLKLLWRHIQQRSQDLSLHGQTHGDRLFGDLNWFFDFRQSKIQQFDALLGDKNIRGLQIAVRDLLAVG